MKRIVLFILSTAIASLPVLADVCKTETWAVYDGLADCTIGNNTLSGFGYVNDALMPFDPSMITASPYGIGLVFTLTGYTLGVPTKTRAIEIKFTATAPGGTTPYKTEILDFSDRDIKTGMLLDVSTTPGGVATISDSTASLSITESSLATKLTDSKSFSPQVNSVSIDDTVKLETGMMGSAQITKYRVFVTTPEPNELILCGIGLLAMVAFSYLTRQRFERDTSGRR
jgi:hypothetical protein